MAIFEDSEDSDLEFEYIIKKNYIYKYPEVKVIFPPFLPNVTRK